MPPWAKLAGSWLNPNTRGASIGAWSRVYPAYLSDFPFGMCMSWQYRVKEFRPIHLGNSK